MYKLNNKMSVIRLIDNAYIITTHKNPEYDEFLEWAKTNTPRPADTPSLVVLQAALLFKIDADIDAIYATVVGNRFVEYQDASLEAKAFKDAGYIGEAGASITSWATVKGQSLMWATDDILATSYAWKAAQTHMRVVRLTHKERVRTSTSPAQLQTVETSWQSSLTTIKTMLGIT